MPTTSQKSFNHDNINKIFVYAFNRNKIAKLYLPSTFQTSDIELLSPKLKLNIRLTKSLKRDHIYKLCLYTLEEHKCLIIINILMCAKAEI